MEKQTVAVLGAGLLGTGFVEKLLENGHTVRVWNRTASKLTELASRGAVVATSPEDAVTGAARVHIVLAEDSAVDAVMAALRPGLGKDVPVFDHSTNLPAGVAPRFARLRAEGVRYLHCPVFMGPANARQATGLMLVAGPQKDADEFTPLLQTMCGEVWFVGERPELAAVYKLIGNGVIISMAGAIGDALTLGAAAGLDASGVNELFAHFNPGSMLPVFAKRVVGSDSKPASFTLEMARKDVRLMLELGGAKLQLLPAVAQAMDKAIDAGGALKDFAIFAKT